MLVRLSNSGFIENFDKVEGEIPNQLTKRARLVYVGDFESMDGPVSVKEEHLQKICTAYNGKLAKLKRLATGSVSVGNLPPVQLDHTRSARDTVGRLENTDLTIEDWTDEDGTKRKALYGQVRFLGKENVEKVLDGRWSTLSIGANFDDGKLDELSVTPFPAAEKATVLSRLNGSWQMWKRHRIEVYYDNFDSDNRIPKAAIVTPNGERYESKKSYRGLGEALDAAKKAVDNKNYTSFSAVEKATVRLQKPVSEFEHKGLYVAIYKTGTNKYYMTADNYNGGGGFDAEITSVSIQEAEKKAKSIVEKSNRLSSINKDSIMKLALYQRLRKYLKLKKKMSDEEVDEKMNKLAEEENEEELKKLTEEAEEQENKLASVKIDDNIIETFMVGDRWAFSINGKQGTVTYHSENEALRAAKQLYETMKKHIKDSRSKLSEHEEKKEMSGDEEEEKKDLSEEDEEEKKKKEEMKKKMSAARESLTKLSTDFRSKKTSAELAAKAASIGSRLSAIRASGRITPAEVKKIDIKALASKSQDAIDAVLKTYEDRQPVIMAGQLGSMKAMSLKQIKAAGERAQEISELEASSRKNMSLLAHTVKETEAKDAPISFGERRLAMSRQAEEPIIDLAAMEKDHDEICKLMDGGKIAEAKERLKSFIRLGSYGLAEPTMHEQSMAQLSALQADLEELSKKFDEAMGLAQSLAAGE